MYQGGPDHQTEIQLDDANLKKLLEYVKNCSNTLKLLEYLKNYWNTWKTIGMLEKLFECSMKFDRKFGKLFEYLQETNLDFSCT